MEMLKCNNDIEIKLLANRRFIYANRKSNIVISAEHSATEITVLFPDEYEEYSKRVDFVNSQGKEWTEGLYTPEYKKYKGGFNKTRFHFTLPSEVTTEGELKMQFLAYLPDESMTTVPFEVIPIDVVNGVFAFKRNARANPDLLILSANKSEQALFNSQRAVAISEGIESQAQAAVETANQTAASFSAERAAREAADAEHSAAIADNALAIAEETIRAVGAESAISAALAAEASRAVTTEQINADAIQAETERALAAETTLGESIDAERTRAMAAESNLQSEFANESSRSIQADAELRADLDTEIARAQTTEQINAAAIAAEMQRATQAETALGYRVTTEVPAVITEAKAYADQVAEQVRIDGTIYKGTLDESELPPTGNENGDLYWISDFNFTQPGHSGSAIWNGKTNKWDFNIDRYKHQDVETIVARDSDGALKVADTEESNLTADTADFDSVVNLGNKALNRTVIRKVRGLFQRSGENAAAITAETSRAQTAESGLSSRINAEETRAKAAEQINANSIAAETLRAVTAEGALSESLAAETARAQTAEQTNAGAIVSEAARAQAAEGGLSARVNAEEVRATAAEQTNANAIAAETTRSLTAESGLASSILTERTRAMTAEQDLATAVAAEETRAMLAEQSLAQNIIATVEGAQSDWNVDDESSLALIKNKPASMPASDVYPWAKAANKPTYTPSEVGAEPALTKNTAFNKNFGSAAGTVCEGNDNRLSNSRPASDVSAWAKATVKPTYTASEVGAATATQGQAAEIALTLAQSLRTEMDADIKVQGFRIDESGDLILTYTGGAIG